MLVSSKREHRKSVRQKERNLFENLDGLSAPTGAFPSALCPVDALDTDFISVDIAAMEGSGFLQLEARQTQGGGGD
jgi:hypothetical protein